jgi:hypothetical protein
LQNDNPSDKGGFGSSVAISADGNTAIIGGPQYGSSTGAVWIFNRSNSTWSQNTTFSSITAPTLARGNFGGSVALSADGLTALVGAYNLATVPLKGAVFTFSNSSGTWTPGTKLVGVFPSNDFGITVAISADGTSGVTGDYAGLQVGSAWFLTP